MLRMRHQAHHVPGLVRHGSHIGHRAVRILTRLVAEDDLAAAFELAEQLRRREPAALAVLDRDHEALPRRYSGT